MRKQIRERIKSPATNLQTYVVNTICDFKDELISLEKSTSSAIPFCEWTIPLNINYEVKELEHLNKI